MPAISRVPNSRLSSALRQTISSPVPVAFVAAASNDRWMIVVAPAVGAGEGIGGGGEGLRRVVGGGFEFCAQLGLGGEVEFRVVGERAGDAPREEHADGDRDQ